VERLEIYRPSWHCGIGRRLKEIERRWSLTPLLKEQPSARNGTSPLTALERGREKRPRRAVRTDEQWRYAEMVKDGGVARCVGHAWDRMQLKTLAAEEKHQSTVVGELSGYGAEVCGEFWLKPFSNLYSTAKATVGDNEGVDTAFTNGADPAIMTAQRMPEDEGEEPSKRPEKDHASKSKGGGEPGNFKSPTFNFKLAQCSRQGVRS